MEKRIKNPNLLLLFGFVLSLSSCDTVDYNFLTGTSTTYITEWPSYAWISSTDSAFLRGQGVLSIDYEEQGFKIQPDKSARFYYVDARSNNGYSNWSDYRVSYSHDHEEENSSTGGWIPITTKSYIERFRSGIALLTPPAHLHMVLDSVDENPVGKIPGKTWEVLSVEDDNGQSLASDPDWSNYTDNLMRFKKTDKFVLYLGEKRTSIENDLFGSADSINGNYRVYSTSHYNPIDDNDYLSITFPGYAEKFTIVYSDWENLTITGTVKGKSGTMKLVPKD